MKRWLSIVGITALAVMAVAGTWRFSQQGHVPAAAQATGTPASGESPVHAGTQSRIPPGSVTSRLSKVVPNGGKTFSLETEVPRFDGPAKAYVEALLPSARAGDAAATYAIYLRVRSCKLALRTLDEAELALARKSGQEAQVLSAQALELDQCATLIASAGLFDERWLASAAEQGALEARLIYATNPAEILGESRQMLAAPERVIAYRAQSMAYLQGAVAQGSLDALAIMSAAYENGIITRQDPIAAYAYAAALVRANPSPAIADLELLPRQKLTAEQLRQGRAMAERIYRDCCISFGESAK